MKTKLNSRRMLPALLVAAGCIFISGLAANPVSAQAQVSDPVVVKSPKPSTKPLKFDGLVISANIATITLRSDHNAALVQTFTYTAKVRSQMESIMNKGGYQFGDKVTVQYAPGTTVASRLKGKPSKPRKFAASGTK